jgi:hypothetical protein
LTAEVRFCIFIEKMFRFLKPKPVDSQKPSFVDIDGVALKEGDIVDSLRYDLGRCRIIGLDSGLGYQSIETGTVVDWSKMVDASTKYQKVRKVLT